MPLEITSALESFHFWYALNSHPDGEERRERLQHLIIDRRDLWTELLIHCIDGQPDWLHHLNASQKFLLGAETDRSAEHAISEASVYELAYMNRNGIISDAVFRTYWKPAMYQDGHEPRENDLFAILGTKRVRPREFTGKQRALLKHLAEQRLVSPRILHVLRKDGIITPENIRSDPSLFQNLLNNVSPLRAKQLIQSGILKREDFSAVQLQSLVQKAKTPGDIQSLLSSGIVRSRQDFPKVVLSRVYSSRRQGSVSPTETPIEWEIKKERSGSRLDVSDKITGLYITEPERLLLEIGKQVSDPRNAPPGAGFGNTLMKRIEESTGWPKEYQEKLLDLAEDFYRANASKKKKPEYLRFVREKRFLLESE